VIREDVEARYGEGFIERVQDVLLGLDAADPAQAEILDLFGAGAFVETRDENYAQIEAVGRAIGRIQD
jgi:phosphonate transport system substrate-binding protein